MAAPVIYRPDGGNPYPLILPGGTSRTPAVTEDPCECCGDGWLCGNCGNEILPNTLTMNVRGVKNGHPFQGCQDCDDLNGSYLMDNRSELGCGWFGVFPINFCPQPFGGSHNLLRAEVGIDATVISFRLIVYLASLPSLTWSRVWQRESNSCLEDLANAELIMGMPRGPTGETLFETCTHEEFPWDLSL